MKLPVYDSINKNRLLGHLTVLQPITGVRYRVALYESYTAYRARTALGSHDPSASHVTFSVDRRSESKAEQIDWATREIVTFERTVLETDAPLSDLVKLDKFTLPDETIDEARTRRRTGFLY